ncbi:hypothetical protein CRI77_26065 [Mycolicibacterium duvalii]|uniref:Uncharacterized protein n=1 Tax=Mycolicibacterium duvalii TaxID=39688 RepID=A0A7I7K800_9MYCO|nr:hypothetical protein [Mycolicibacterium duvalii]MCV7368039.1 hypothetical protein [Mycolicibacterium duvalii]PEG35038.1 hypothetical protein CRI77_26065 [Mycolicibacterium duvalii]BBX19689.1 hypothetical protein MDUV_45490 [Mycolicibacterium duvalii]
MIVWVIAGLLGLATGLRIGWALVNKQSVVSTAMILALGSLGAVAALNWQPLTLLVDTALGWPNISMGLSQVALIGCAAGSCVMITTVASVRSPAAARKIAIVQYSVAAVIATASLAAFLSAGRQAEMSPQEYLRHNVGADAISVSWLLPLLYVLLALSLVVWAGLRHSNRSRRGRALFVFTIGIVLIALALAFFLLRAVGTGATMLGIAMLIVAAGSLLPSLEDWFGARRELRAIAPLLDELGRRHPDVGIGVRPRGPLVFRVAERMSLISDALYLEATAAAGARRLDHDVADTDEDAPSAAAAPEDAGESAGRPEPDVSDEPDVSARDQAATVAGWIHQGRSGDDAARHRGFPGLAWLRQPSDYSDREWILEIARQYRAIDRGKGQPAPPVRKRSPLPQRG